jgi:homogentisate 1,2-dioxygenase
MPLYHKLGTFPKKDIHIRKPNGGLYYEQLFGTEGFHGIPLSYHVHRPTQVKEILKSYSEPKIALEKHQIIIVKGFELKPEDDF